MTAGFVTKKIGKNKRTLGAILKAARSKADLTIEQAEEETKVSAKYLMALESGQYEQMPAEAYNIGYVRRYAECLKLSPERIVQLYRMERSSQRQTQDKSNARLLPRRVGDWNFLVTPKLLGIIGMLVVFGGVSGYIIYQVRKFAQPPVLSLTNVPTEFTSENDTVVLEGKTSEGAVVLMNSEPIYVTPGGGFSQDVQLSPGVNQILVQAKSRAEKESRLTVKVLYKPDLARSSSSLPIN